MRKWLVIKIMSRSRLNLHERLCNVLGSRNCYFSPPASLHMKYPCIRYSYTNDDDRYADDDRYIRHRRYTVTVMDWDPDSEVPERLKKEFRFCSIDRVFTVDNLNHFTFTLFY